MKKLYAIIALITTTAIFAQAPQGFNYQATVRNSSGDLIANQNVFFKFNIMLNSSTSLPVFSETHMAPTDDLGQVNLVIGQGTASIGNFSNINWANGNYYLGIELNTGSGYVAMGTTQLLSVPFALYANSSGNSQSSTPNLESVLAINNSANNQQIKNLADPTDTKDAVTKEYVDQLQAQITDIQNQINDLENQIPSMYPSGTIHCNQNNPTTIVEVTNPVTGKTWMDRNLGATQVATSSTDINAYGDLYQWGRRADGHQCRNSATTSALSSTDVPNHGDYILAPNTPNDWRSPQNNNLWQGVNGINNPCPSGYRLPSSVEWGNETESWTTPNSNGAFSSPLKLTLAGGREGSNNSNGSLFNIGTFGYYWSSNTINNLSSCLNINVNFYSHTTDNRARGRSVRCIKN